MGTEPNSETGRGAGVASQEAITAAVVDVLSNPDVICMLCAVVSPNGGSSFSFALVAADGKGKWLSRLCSCICWCELKVILAVIFLLATGASLPGDVPHSLELASLGLQLTPRGEDPLTARCCWLSFILEQKRPMQGCFFWNKHAFQT